MSTLNLQRAMLLIDSLALYSSIESILRITSTLSLSCVLLGGYFTLTRKYGREFWPEFAFIDGCSWSLAAEFGDSLQVILVLLDMGNSLKNNTK